MTLQTSHIVALCIPIYTRSFVSAHPGIGATNPQEIGQRGQRARPRSVSKLVAETEFWPRSPGPISTECKPKAQMGGVRGFLTERGDLQTSPSILPEDSAVPAPLQQAVGEGERGQAAALQGVKTSGGVGAPTACFCLCRPKLQPPGLSLLQRVHTKIPVLSITWAWALCTLNQCLSAESTHNNVSHQSRGYCVSDTPLSTFHVCQLVQASQQPLWASLSRPFHRRGNQGTKEEILYVTHLKLT